MVKPGYKVTEVGVIPEDWGVEAIGELATFASGNGINVSKLSPQSADTPFPVYGGNGIAGYTSKPLVNVSTVIVGRVGQKCGEVYLSSGPAWITDNALYPRKMLKQIDTQFFAFSLIAEGLNNVKNQNDLPLVTQAILHSVQIPLPPTKTEQTAIATALSDVDALLTSLDELIAKKRDIKKAAMQQLLTGKRRLPGFEKKRGFKQTEVGEIPVDWEVKSFSELFHISGGYTASRDQLSDTGYCYLHYGDIHTSNKFYIDVSKEIMGIPKLDIALNKVASKSLLADGDIVFVDASEDDDGTSKHIVVRNTAGIPYISGLHTIVVKSKTDEFDNSFKEFCFQMPYIKNQFYFYAVGTKVSGISKTNILKILLVLPGKSEQTAIATILTDLDAEITALEHRRDKTKSIKQAMMQELLTGRIRLVVTPAAGTGKTGPA